VQGLPFFAPIYDSRQQINFYAPPAKDETLEDLLTAQMRYEFFPLEFTETTSQRRFLTAQPAASEKPAAIAAGAARIGILPLHRQQPHSAYRLDIPGKSVTYAVHINWEQPYPTLGELAAFMKGTDLLITNMPGNDREGQTFKALLDLTDPRRILFSDFSPQWDDKRIAAGISTIRNQIAAAPEADHIAAAHESLRISL
ncbi:hypothetical protein IJT17_08945, partial [bacterium]|nr:hypothetical protein [bacterium]